MNEKKKTLVLIVLFIILIFGASYFYQSLSQNYKPDTLAVEDSSEETPNTPSTDDNSSENEDTAVQTAPDFTVYNSENNQVHLSDFFGKPVIINFWASWCVPCQSEMPDFDSAYTKYQNDINFLMVNMTDGSRETIEIASSFITEKGYNFPVYYDSDYSATLTYSVTSLPTTYFINANGELVAHAKGAIDAATLQKGIDMILEP